MLEYFPEARSLICSAVWLSRIIFRMCAPMQLVLGQKAQLTGAKNDTIDDEESELALIKSEMNEYLANIICKGIGFISLDFIILESYHFTLDFKLNF